MKVVIDGVEYLPKSDVSMMPRKFGEFLKAARKSVNYTLDQAAESIGCSKSYIWELENGTGEPSLRMARGIASAYGLKLETIASYLDCDS